MSGKRSRAEIDSTRHIEKYVKTIQDYNTKLNTAIGGERYSPNAVKHATLNGTARRC